MSWCVFLRTFYIFYLLFHSLVVLLGTRHSQSPLVRQGSQLFFLLRSLLRFRDLLRRRPSSRRKLGSTGLCSRLSNPSNNSASCIILLYLVILYARSYSNSKSNRTAKCIERSGPKLRLRFFFLPWATHMLGRCVPSRAIEPRHALFIPHHISISIMHHYPF